MKKILLFVIAILGNTTFANDQQYYDGNYELLLVQKCATELITLSKIRESFSSEKEQVQLVDSLIDSQITYLLITRKAWRSDSYLQRLISLSSSKINTEWNRIPPSKYVNKKSIDFIKSASLAKEKEKGSE